MIAVQLQEDKNNHDGLFSAFSKHGTLFKITPSEIKENFVVAIFENERTTLIKRDLLNNSALNLENKFCLKKIQPIFKNEKYNFYLSEDYYNSLSKCEAIELESDYLPTNVRLNEDKEPLPITDPILQFPPGNSQSADCDRTINEGKYDNLHQLKFTGRPSFRKANGGDQIFEYGLAFKVIVLHTIGGEAQTPLTKFFYARDGQFKDCFFSCTWKWANIDLDIIRWREEDHGRYMRYLFYEVDYGPDVVITQNFTSEYKVDENTTNKANTTVSITIKAEDDDLGGAYVEFCDNTVPGSEYTTGDLQFKVRQ